MIQYLLQILENNNRVIIPEFGAFIIKHREPLTIVFNEFLQYNDGQLIDAIAKQEKIDRESAKEKLDEFVKSINDTLNKGKEFSLGQLGILTKNTAGRISLEESGTTDQPKVKKETKEVHLETEKETKKEEPTSTVKEAKPHTEKEPVKTESRKDPGSSFTKPEKSNLRSPLYQSKQSGHEEPSHARTSKNHIVKEPERNYQKEIPETKSRRINVIAWIVVILIVNGIIIAYFLTSERLDKYFLKEEAKSETATAEKSAVKKPVVEKVVTPAKTQVKTQQQVMAEIEDSVKKAVKEQMPAKAAAISGKRYYIVAGVFSNEQNAIKMVKQLKQKGYNAENFGKIGTMFAVSYDVYSSKEEADKSLSKIKKEYDPKAWIKVKE
jgi:nucleoid DNA-binding protein